MRSLDLMAEERLVWKICCTPPSSRYHVGLGVAGSTRDVPLYKKTIGALDRSLRAISLAIQHLRHYHIARFNRRT